MGYSDAPCVPEEYKKKKEKKPTRTGWGVEMEWQRLAGEHWGQCQSTESVFISISVFFFWVKLLKLLKKY